MYVNIAIKRESESIALRFGGNVSLHCRDYRNPDGVLSDTGREVWFGVQQIIATSVYHRFVCVIVLCTYKCRYMDS